MRTMFLGVFIAGVGLAGVSVYMVKQFVGQQRAQLDQAEELFRRTGPLVLAYVSKKPFNYGDQITADDIQLVYMQKSALPEGIFTAENPVFADGAKDPRYVVREFAAMEPILASKVTKPGESAGLTSMLKPGQRAFTIAFDDTSGGSRLLQAKNRVDIYWTGTDLNGEQKTLLIEPAMEIIAIDRNNQRASEGAIDFSAPKSLTLAATQEQVARLAQATASGRISVSLVGNEDVTSNATVEVTRSIFGETPVAEAAPAEKICTIRVTKGDTVEERPIPCATN